MISKDLELFIQSPFFNNDQLITQFYNEVIETIISQKKLNKQSIFTKLFPREVYSDTKLRLLQSNLFRLIERFLRYKILWKTNIYIRR